MVVLFIFHWWPKSAGSEIKRERCKDDRTKLDLYSAFKMLIHLKRNYEFVFLGPPIELYEMLIREMPIKSWKVGFPHSVERMSKILNGL